MLTIEPADHELKITWTLNSDSSEDLMGFQKIHAIEEKGSLKSCSFYFVGEKEIPLLVWRALVAALKVLLEHQLTLHFIYTSAAIEAALRSFGFDLLGSIVRAETTPDEKKRALS